MIPSDPPLEALSRFERAAVRFSRRMNSGRWQRFWFRCQRQIGARWIAALTGPLVEVHGLEHVEATSRDRPLLLVANHRTLFDLFVVMSVLFLRLAGWQAINFPVRGRYFYQNPGGMLLNGLAAFWSMYPPFFHGPAKHRFDQWALAELASLCRERPGQLVGFHPEGTRNRNTDPYSFLPVQPGIGRLMLDARPQVVPVFIAGLSNSLVEILRRRGGDGERIRIWFGPAIDYRRFCEGSTTAGTYRGLAEFVMGEIKKLGESDKIASAAASCSKRATGSGTSRL